MSFLADVLVFSSPSLSAEPAQTAAFRLPLAVTSHLPFPKVPMDPEIDFGRLLHRAGTSGMLDPNSIRVVDLRSGETVSHALSEDFSYGDKGRIEWVIDDPRHTDYEIRFRTVSKRPFPAAAKFTPSIGVGDLLRYNAGAGRPVGPTYLSRLIDLTGDGRRDLVGCWNYFYRPGWPTDGVICFPRVAGRKSFEFGDLVRIRYVDSLESTDYRHFRSIYMHADFADLNGDGCVDVVYSPRREKRISLYLGSDKRDAGGMPVFVLHGRLDRQTESWGPCRAVDLNRDGAVDFVIGTTYLRNTNPQGWPITLDKAAELNAGHEPCFFDVDGDGALDAVCLADKSGGEVHVRHVAWRKNLGDDPPQFEEPQSLADIDAWDATHLAAVPDGAHRGLLVQHNSRQVVSFYEQLSPTAGRPRFRKFGTARSDSAVIALSDQAWPCACDWDGDGDWDLLVGGGYGWSRILINDGDNTRPAFGEPQFILADGKPIRILRDEVLGGEHWHNMGYPFPVSIDWDADGLSDLMLPNETNRIFWYKNIGTRRSPAFGRRRQIICDGFPDSPARRAQSRRLAGDRDVPNHPYPYERDRPFFWRTGVAFADWTGDGLVDLVTHDGHVRKATLFAQYRAAGGRLRLRKVGPLKLGDGRLIDDSIVAREAHWTESFRAADWDGDGLLDLIYSCAGSHHKIQDGGSIFLLRNCGTRSEPLFEDPVTLRCFGAPIRVSNHGPQPWVGDLDGDGKPDLLTCTEWSVYPFYSHAAIEMKERPKFSLGTVDRITERRGN